MDRPEGGKQDTLESRAYEALKTAIARRLRAEDERYCAVIQVDHSYVE